MSTPAGTVTPEQLARMRDGEKHLELIGGVVRDRIKGMMAGYVSGKVLSALHAYTDTHGHYLFPRSLGYCGIWDDPNTVRRANVTLIKAGRLTRAKFFSGDPFSDVSPDLAAEVIGYQETAAGLADDVAAWLRAGVPLVWVIDPRSRTVAAHRGDGGVILHDAADALTAADILPGFSVPVADLFRVPGEPAPAPPPTV